MITLEELKQKMIEDAQEIFNQVQKRPGSNVVLTNGTEIMVDAGYQDLQNFEIGKKMQIDTIKARDNNYYKIDVSEDYDLIINAIEQRGLELLKTKWQIISDIMNAETIEDLENIEIIF